MGERGGAVSLEELVALNEEVSALVRAGVPLGKGLSGLGGDLKGRVGGLAGRLGKSLEAGESLTEALERESESVPRLYRSVVEAGARAGRLPAALEGVATYARSVSELRTTIGLALLYPLVVLLVGYSLFVGLTVVLAPRLEMAFEDMKLTTPMAVRGLSRLGESALWWGPALPIAMVVGAIAWGWTGRARSLDPSRIGRGLGWLPWVGGMVSSAKAAMYADLLALLLENRVPLSEAMELAGEASGESRLRTGSRRAAEAVRSGAGPGEIGEGLPPMLRWILSTGGEDGTLSASLRRAAGLYHERANETADILRTMLPAGLMIVIGGGAALLYGLSLFVPVTELLEQLSA